MKQLTIILLAALIIGCAKKSTNTTQTDLQKFLPGIDTVHFKAYTSDKKITITPDGSMTATAFSTATNTYIQEYYKLTLVDTPIVGFTPPPGTKFYACHDNVTDSIIGTGAIGLLLADNGIRRYYYLDLIFNHSIPIRLANGSYVDSL